MAVNLHIPQEEIEHICKQSGITYLALFGSHARGDNTKDSDVDLLVDFKETPGLIEFIRLKQSFEKVLNRKVDLVTKNALSKRLKPEIEKDLRIIYG